MYIFHIISRGKKKNQSHGKIVRTLAPCQYAVLGVWGMYPPGAGGIGGCIPQEQGVWGMYPP